MNDSEFSSVFLLGLYTKKYLVINSDNDNSCLLEPLDFSKIFFF